MKAAYAEGGLKKKMESKMKLVREVARRPDPAKVRTGDGGGSWPARGRWQARVRGGEHVRCGEHGWAEFMRPHFDLL